MSKSGTGAGTTASRTTALSSTPSRAFLIAGVVAIGVYFLLPAGAQNFGYDAFGLACVAAIVVGVVHHRPPRRLVWWLFAGGVLLFVAGDALLSMYQYLHGEQPFPSAADGLYLGGYLLLAAGLLTLIRARAKGADRAAMIDALIIAIGLGVLAWAFWMEQYTGDPSLSLEAKLISVAYPLMDVVLLGGVARLALGPGRRVAAFYLLGLSLLVLLVADVVYGLTSLGNSYQVGDAVDGAYALSYVLWGASALHPSMRRMSSPARVREQTLTRGRTAGLAVAALVGPLAMGIESLRGQPVDVPVIVVASALIFLLVLARMGGLMRRLVDTAERQAGERARLEHAIRRIGETFASNLDRDGLLEIVVRTAVDAVNAEYGRATARRGPNGPLLERASNGRPGGLGDAIRAAERLARESGRSEQVTHDRRRALASPLGSGQGKLEAFVSVARVGRAFGAAERELFNYLAREAAVSLENVELHELVQRQALTDELTGLFNHRHFQEVIRNEVERARRFEHGVGLIMLDIDDFKQVNDTFGHQQGDLVLHEVGRVVRRNSREIDEPARYGGEELAVALPLTDLDGAASLAERIRLAIEELEIPRLDGYGVLRITASFGVAALPQSAIDHQGLIAAADAALYRAKRAGKNRTERADPLAATVAPAG
ncbi:MAG: diguanylate cyclase [Solirubrobacteraceae bacterium]